MRKALRTVWRIITFPFRLIFWPFRQLARGLAALRNNLHTFFTEEVDDEPLPEAFAKTIENPQGLLVHLDALRKHLLRSVLALAVTTVISFTFTPRFIAFLAEPIGGIDKLQAIEVTEPLGVFMKVALLSGFAIALPYIALELWLFIAPGVSPRARLSGILAIPAVLVFFLAGMAFAYYIMLPSAVRFLIHFMGFANNPRPASYISFTTGLMFWIGAAFEFPLVIFVLASIGLVKAKVLLNQWRLAVVLIAFVAAAITPTVDPVNMSLVMGPMILLYFLSIGLAYIAQGRRA
jgi:sec-independent protein translocase protein TatC